MFLFRCVFLFVVGLSLVSGATLPANVEVDIKVVDIVNNEIESSTHKSSGDLKDLVGSIEPKVPEGSIEPKVPEGTIEPKVPEGTIEPKVPEGTIEPKVPEGTIEPKVPEGTTEPKVPEGTIEPKVPEGTIEPKVPEGTIETKVPECSLKPKVTEGSVEPKDTEDSTKSPAEIPVNERYPHAVQFGSTCGGTIISPNWVLTAGHCAMSNWGNGVLAGTNNTENGSGVYRDGKRLIIHPLFSVGPHFLNAHTYKIRQVAARWDFLLVELDEPLPLDGKTIAAATLNEEADLPAGLQVGFAGYGAEEHGGYMRSEMHAMDLEVVDDAVCQAALVEYNPKEMICTRGRPPRFDSACNGDSGSGLVDGSRRLLGVASWVEDDAVECRSGTLVIFARVSIARDWIREITGI